MADLNDIQAADAVKIVGSSSSGVEQTPVQSTSQGGLHINIRNNAGSELGVSGSPIRIDPTGATTQPISATSLPLPAGAATEVTLASVDTSINNIEATLRTNTPTLANTALVVRTVPYEPPTFVISAYDVVLGNNKSMIAILNPVGSPVVFKIRDIRLVNNRTTATTGVAADFRFRRITGLSAGTAITPASYDTIDTIQVGTVCSTGGTVAGESTLDLMRRVWSSDEWGPGTLDQEGLDHAFQQNFPTWQDSVDAKPIVLRAGQGLTVKCITNTTNGSFDFEITFTQES